MPKKDLVTTRELARDIVMGVWRGNTVTVIIAGASMGMDCPHIQVVTSAHTEDRMMVDKRQDNLKMTFDGKERPKINSYHNIQDGLKINVLALNVEGQTKSEETNAMK